MLTKEQLKTFFQKPVLLDGFREAVEYDIPSMGVRKQVVFFLGFYENQEIIPQESELYRAAAVSFDEAMALLGHEDNRRILAKADRFLKNHDEI